MHIQPYLFFDGRCDEAIEFYKKAIGAQVQMLMRFKDSPEKKNDQCAPADLNKVMHAQVRVGETTVLMSDGQAKGKPKFEGFALSLYASNEAEAERLFSALGEGGQVQMPLTKTFFSPRFGMLSDQFGVFWMVLVKTA
jgi:PhnB protein